MFSFLISIKACNYAFNNIQRCTPRLLYRVHTQSTPLNMHKHVNYLHLQTLHQDYQKLTEYSKIATTNLERCVQAPTQCELHKYDFNSNTNLRDLLKSGSLEVT